MAKLPWKLFYSRAYQDSYAGIKKLPPLPLVLKARDWMLEQFLISRKKLKELENKNGFSLPTLSNIVQMYLTGGAYFTSRTLVRQENRNGKFHLSKLCRAGMPTTRK